MSILFTTVSLSTMHSTAGRSTVNFDFAWRFRLGLQHPPSPPPPPTPSVGCAGANAFAPANGLQCGGLSPFRPKGTTAALCEKACCDDNACAVWQWEDPKIQGGGCWLGECTAGFNKVTSWVGGNRSAPVPPAPTPAPLPPGVSPPESKVAYDDSSWELINAPHDSLINQSASKELCAGGCSGHSYIPRYDSWYRKHFALPQAWALGAAEGAIWLRFDGVFRETTIWLNGVNISSHISGYTSFSVRLPNELLKFGTSGGVNVVALLTDPNKGKTGWWYEGGGLYRHVRLVRTNALHIASDGVMAYSNLTGIDARGATASGASMHASVAVENDLTTPAEHVQARFTLFDTHGASVGSQTSAVATVPGTTTSEFHAVLSDLGVSVKLWGPKTPTLYTLATEILINGITTGDGVNRSFGFRSLQYDSTVGMQMNGKHFKWRGFCDHNNFASVGMAVPDRVKLFRAQASRSVGGNGRRTSHNAPDPVMLDIYDRIGIAVMDENRNLGNSSEDENEMRDMVRRDRVHPSVVVWSFCNEAGCESSFQQEGGPRFQKATYELDGSRPTLANMFTYNDLLSKTIDVQGFSHKNRALFVAAHAAMPEKPLWASECCSCNTMRGEAGGAGSNTQSAFNAPCQQSQTNATDGVEWAIGTTVWTLFDYYGEPSYGGWPFVSSTFGAFDLAGFAKAGAFWFRSQWLTGIADTNYDKPFATDALPTLVRIVESWEHAPPPPPPLPPQNVTSVGHCLLGALGVREEIRVKVVPSNASKFQIISSAGLCLDSTGSKSGCTNATLGQEGCYPLAYLPCDVTDPKQQWKRGTGGTGGFNSFISVTNDGCIDIYAGGVSSSKVGVYKCSGPQTVQQNWKYDAENERLSTSSGLCLADGIQNDPLGGARDIHVYATAPAVELWLNGVSQGFQSGLQLGTSGGPSWATFSGLTFAAGNLTAVAQDSAHKTLGVHTVLTSGAPAKLVLTIDAPSAATGTGTALLLDGQDVGLLRAEIVDAHGNFCALASGVNISFKIVSGPGEVMGVHSGDPKSHEPNQRAYHTSYNGLVRGVIRVTSDAAMMTGLRRMVDVDGRKKHEHRAVVAAVADGPSTPIVVEVSASGLVSATVSIATSTDAATDSVLAVAERYGNAVLTGFV